MCVFCEIVKGNIPSKKIYEDEKILAILDISQTTYGHTLVMPKNHYENILECPKEELHSVIENVQELARKITTNLNAKGFNILVNTGETAGQTVPHLHFHIIPRYKEEDSIIVEFSENKFNLDEVQKEILK